MSALHGCDGLVDRIGGQPSGRRAITNKGFFDVRICGFFNCWSVEA